MTNEITHPFSHRIGLQVIVALLAGSGALCPKCGFGTRVTSKRWRKCKRCGERVARRSLDDVGNELLASVTPTEPTNE